MGDEIRDYFFRQIAAADPSKSTTSVRNGDLESTYYDMANHGLLAPGGPRRRISAKVSVIGDSISASDEYEIGINGQTNQIQANSWFSYACMLSGGVLQRGVNGGIPGDTSTQMLARIKTDVLSSSPGIVIILAGTNDIGQSVSAGGSIADATMISTYKSNIKQMVSLISASGAIPVLSTIPVNNAANRKALITQLNLWLKFYAATNGFTLLDFYGQSVDPTNGSYLSSWGSSDGTHPGTAGHLAFGQYVSNKLTPLVGVNAPLVAQDNNDPNNLLTNPLFLGGALSAQGIPPGWQIASGYPTGVTVSYVTDSAVAGNMWQVNASASSGPYYVQFPIPAGKWSPGDEIVASGILTSNAGLAQNINLSTQSGTQGQVKNGQAVTRGYFNLRQIVPASATSLYFNLNCPGGTGIWSVGQLGIYNLTKLGLTS